MTIIWRRPEDFWNSQERYCHVRPGIQPHALGPKSGSSPGFTAAETHCGDRAVYASAAPLPDPCPLSLLEPPLSPPLNPDGDAHGGTFSPAIRAVASFALPCSITSGPLPFPHDVSALLLILPRLLVPPGTPCRIHSNLRKAFGLDYCLCLLSVAGPLFWRACLLRTVYLFFFEQMPSYLFAAVEICELITAAVNLLVPITLLCTFSLMCLPWLYLPHSLLLGSTPALNPYIGTRLFARVTENIRHGKRLDSRPFARVTEKIKHGKRLAFRLHHPK